MNYVFNYFNIKSKSLPIYVVKKNNVVKKHIYVTFILSIHIVLWNFDIVVL